MAMILQFRRTHERVTIELVQGEAGLPLWLVEAHLASGSTITLDLAPSLQRARQVAHDWDTRRIEVRA